MTAPLDLDRALGAWLREVPPHSDRARAMVLARLATTPQARRRTWWPLSLRRIGRSSPILIGSPEARTRTRTAFPAMPLIGTMIVVIVGTGGLFLATGQAPPTTAPAPWTPPAGLVTREIEPGVHVVESDGIRDLAWEHGYYQGISGEIVVGADGGVWSFTRPPTSDPARCTEAPCEFYRVGDPQSHGWMSGPGLMSHDFPTHHRTIDVAPDGTVWAVFDDDWPYGGALWSYDGEQWAERWKASDGGSVTQVRVAPDGTVWASWVRREAGQYVVGVDRLRPDGGEWHPGPTFTTPESPLGPAPTLGQLVASPNGEFLLLDLGSEVLRLEDAEGQIAAEPYAPGPTRRGQYNDGMWSPLWVADDGSLWLVDSLSSTELVWWASREAQADDGNRAFLDWRLAPTPREDDPPRVIGAAPDGSVWRARGIDGPCGSGHVERFEGATGESRTYLAGWCVYSIDFAPDGSVWLHASQADPGPSSVATMEVIWIDAAAASPAE